MPLIFAYTQRWTFEMRAERGIILGTGTIKSSRFGGSFPERRVFVNSGLEVALPLRLLLCETHDKHKLSILLPCSMYTSCVFSLLIFFRLHLLEKWRRKFNTMEIEWNIYTVGWFWWLRHMYCGTRCWLSKRRGLLAATWCAQTTFIQPPVLPF